MSDKEKATKEIRELKIKLYCLEDLMSSVWDLCQKSETGEMIKLKIWEKIQDLREKISERLEYFHNKHGKYTGETKNAINR